MNLQGRLMPKPPAVGTQGGYAQQVQGRWVRHHKGDSAYPNSVSRLLAALLGRPAASETVWSAHARSYLCLPTLGNSEG